MITFIMKQVWNGTMRYTKCEVKYEEKTMALFNYLTYKNGGKDAETGILVRDADRVEVIFVGEGKAHILYDIKVTFLTEEEAKRDGSAIIDEETANSPVGVMQALIPMFVGGMKH